MATATATWYHCRACVSSAAAAPVGGGVVPLKVPFPVVTVVTVDVVVLVVVVVLVNVVVVFPVAFELAVVFGGGVVAVV